MDIKARIGIDVAALERQEGTLTTAKPPKTPNQLYLRARKVSKDKPSTFYPVLPIVPIRQHRPADCILCCMLMCMRYYGMVVNEEQIMAQYKDRYSDEDGSTYDDAAKFLKFYGFKTHWIGTDIDSLNEAKKEGNPVIYDFRLTESLGHALVFGGSDGTWSYFADPDIGQWIKMPTDLFTEIMEPTSAAALEVDSTGQLKSIV